MPTQRTSIGRCISILYRLGQRYLDRELKTYNLGSGQLMFLLTLLRQDGITQEMLASLLGIDKGTTARAIHKLEEEGYIKRLTDPNDKRANLVYVTPRALNFKPLLLEILARWTNDLLADFSPEERELALKYLNLMSQNALKLFHDES